MNKNNSIILDWVHHKSSCGNKEWGTFTIRSGVPLSKPLIISIASAHGFGGQSFTCKENREVKDGILEMTYTGSFDCDCS
jgi:hypothetical protein